MAHEDDRRSIAVLGAGSSGQAVAGYLAAQGYRIRLWNRAEETELRAWVEPIREHGGIQLRGWTEGFAPIETVTVDLAEAITGADVVLLNTTADAIGEIGSALAPLLTGRQAVIVMAAGVLGGLDFWKGLISGGFTEQIAVGETSTTVFGSKSVGDGAVEIQGIKGRVGLSGLPAHRTEELLELIPEFPFVRSSGSLSTGFSNLGPTLHVAPMVLNSGWVEARGGSFKYYRDAMTPAVTRVIQRVEEERRALAEAFGVEATSLSEYLVGSLGAPAGELYNTIQGCAMYAEVRSPEFLDHRFLWEDTLTAAVPWTSLARVVDVPTPATDALVTLAGDLLGRDMRAGGRTLASLGLEGSSAAQIADTLSTESGFAGWQASLAR